MLRPASASGRCRLTLVTPTAYTPYGYSAIARLSQTGYVGAVQEGLRGCYGFGQGYRYLNSVMMRFETPDSLSPFDQGGLNAYAYCAGDPVNHVDPTGHLLERLKFWKRPRSAPMTPLKPEIDFGLAQARAQLKHTLGILLRPEKSNDLRSNFMATLRDKRFREPAAQALGTDWLNRLESNQKVWEFFASGEYLDRRFTRILKPDAAIITRYIATEATLAASGIGPESFAKQLKSLRVASMAQLDRSVLLELKKIRQQL